MLDIKFIQQNSEYTKERLSTRGLDGETLVTDLLAKYEQYKTCLNHVNTMKAKANLLSKEVGKLERAKKDIEKQKRVETIKAFFNHALSFDDIEASRIFDSVGLTPVLEDIAFKMKSEDKDSHTR